MNRAQMVAAFAEEELRTFKGRGGKIMTFIEDETVMDRLDAGYGFGNWQILVEPVPTDPGVVKVRLGVREQGEWTWYEDFGYPNQPDGDVLKEAVSDGIRRCGRYVGIARDLYRKSTYEPGGALGPKPSSERNLRVGAADYQPPAVRPNDGLIGTVKKQAARTTDFELRQSPDGPFLGFRLKDGAGAGVICEARGDMAATLILVRDQLLEQRVQVWGSWVDYGPPVVEHPYRAYRVERIQAPDFTLPAPDAAAEAGSDELDALPLLSGAA